MPGRHSSANSRRSLATICSIFAIVASVVPWTLATSASASTGTLFGGFEIDGTLVSGDLNPPPTGIDWSDSGTVGTQPVKTDPIGGADNSVFSGSKESQPAGWDLKTNAPGKDDIGPIYFFNRIDPVSGHQFLYFAFERASNVGTVNFVVELNQNVNIINSNGVSIPDRTLGDLRFNVTQNGNMSTLAGHGVDQYDGTKYVPFNNPPAAFDSAVNTVPIPGLTPGDPVAAANGGNIPAGQFAEFAFDMTALTPAGKPCSIPPFSELNSRSRASDSNTAEVKDFIAPLSLKLPGSCFDLTVQKFKEDGTTPLKGATFKFEPDPTDGTSASLTVTDGGAKDPDGTKDGVIEFPNATPLPTSVGGPTVYTVTETAAPDGYLLASPTHLDSTAALAFHTDTLSFTDTLGSVTFTKVDGSNGNVALPGASFTVTGTSGEALTQSVVVNVTDGGTNDADGTADGSITVDGLVTGGYSLVESAPPSGYTKDTSTKTFTISDPPAVAGVSGPSVTLAAPTFTDLVATTPELSILKTDSADPVSVGDPLSYTLAVSNPGTGDTTGPVIVTDTVPTGLTLTGVSGTDWDCTATVFLTNSVSCTYTANGGVLAHGASASGITVTTTVTSAAIPAGKTSATISNTAHVDDATDNLSEQNTQTTKVVAPDLAIDKKSSVDPATVGAPFDYTLSIQNVGDGPVRASDTMTVTDTIDASLTINSITSGAWDCSGTVGNSVSCTLAGPLASGASTDDIVINVTPTVANPALSNTGNVSVANDPNSANDSSTVVIAVQNTPAAPAASFTDSCGPPTSITVALTNTGGTDEDVTITKPDGTQEVVPVPANTNPATVATTRTYTVTAAQNSVSVDSTHIVSQTHTFSLRCAGPPPPPAPPNLTLVKSSLPTSGATVQIGDSITYTLDYANTGGSDATGSLVSDPLPADVTFVSADNGGSYDAATNTVSWALGTIQPGTSGTVSFVVMVATTATDGEVITNVGAISAAGLSPVSSNPVTVTVTVTPPTPTLDIVKKVNKSSAEFGDTLTYSFTVTAGGVDQTGIKATDTIPDGTTYVPSSATCSTGCSASLSGGVLTWDIGNLAQGQTVDLSFKVTIDTPASAADGSIPAVTIHNFGLVNSHELVDPVESNRVKTDVIAVLPLHVTRPPSHSPLPFTGLPVGLVQLLTMSLGAVGIGSLMVQVARSRRRMTAGTDTPLDE